MPRRGAVQDEPRREEPRREEPRDEARNEAPAPRRRGREPEKPLALSFFGIGPITEADLRSNLDDLVGRRDATVYLGVSKDTEVDTFGDVINWAADAKVPVTIFTSDRDSLSRAADAWLGAADDVQEVNDVIRAVVERLSDRRNVDGRLLLFWDKEAADSGGQIDDAQAYVALEAADEAGVGALNICDALDPITLKAPDEPPEQSRAETPPDEPARSSRRSRSVRDEAPVAEPEKAEQPRRGRRRSPEPPDEAQAGEDTLSRPEAAQIAANGHAGNTDLGRVLEDVLDRLAELILAKLEQTRAETPAEPAATGRSRRSRSAGGG